MYIKTLILLFVRGVFVRASAVDFVDNAVFTTIFLEH